MDAFYEEGAGEFAELARLTSGTYRLG